MRNIYSSVWPDCDPSVEAALTKFHAAVTPSHSLTSKKFSLISLIAIHLDIAVNDFMSRFHNTKPIDLSSLVKISTRNADDYLKKALREYSVATSTAPSHVKTYEIMQATIDSLRDVVQFCDSYVSEDVTYITKIGDFHRKKRTKKRGSTKPADLADYLLFSHGNFCRFCYRKTESFLEYKRASNEIVVEAELGTNELKYAKEFKGGIGKVRTKGFSTTYCKIHNPSEDKSSYNKALQKKVLFYSIMKLIVDIRKRMKAQPMDQEELRFAAYCLVEFYPNKMELPQSVTLIKRYYLSADLSEKNAVAIEIYNLYQNYMLWFDQYYEKFLCENTSIEIQPRN